MSEATSEVETSLPASLPRRLLCKLGFHKWSGIYTNYIFDPNYKIDWGQFCLYCPTEMRVKMKST